jgi:hypothetical protein
MSTVVEKSPTINYVIYLGWVDPEEAYASDDKWAAGETDGLEHGFRGYGFDIPSNQQIDAVKIKIEHQDEIGWRVYVAVSWDGGNTWGPGHEVPNRTSDTVDVVDVTNDTNWTPNKLSDTNFRVAVHSANVGAGGCYHIDSELMLPDGIRFPMKNCKRGMKVLGWEGGVDGNFKIARVRKVVIHERDPNTDEPFHFVRVYCKIPEYRMKEMNLEEEFVDIAVTLDHPLWERRRGSIPASELKVGDYLSGLFFNKKTKKFELDACRVEKLEYFDDWKCLNIEADCDFLFYHFKLQVVIK